MPGLSSQPVFWNADMIIFFCSRELVATVIGNHTSTSKVSR